MQELMGRFVVKCQDKEGNDIEVALQDLLLNFMEGSYDECANEDVKEAAAWAYTAMSTFVELCNE